MSHTATYEVQQAAWLRVTQEGANAFIQLQSPGPVYVFVGPSAPSAQSFEGVELHDRGLMEVSIDNVETADSVYLRCKHDETNLVAVMASGAAPAPA